MNAGVKWAVAAFCLPVACVVLPLAITSKTSVGLTVLRRATEEGKPVVYFQLRTPEEWSPAMSRVTKSGIGWTEEFVTGSNAGIRPTDGFWAPSQKIGPSASPVIKGGNREFGVCYPSKSPWKLQFYLYFGFGNLAVFHGAELVGLGR
jgi:hypothetical protein